MICPKITLWDRAIIYQIQSALNFLPDWVPLSFNRISYGVMIAIPVLGFGLYFIIKRKWLDMVLIGAIPLIAFGANSVFKEIIQRPRPPYELQMIKLESFSYVSSHTLITLCLWAAVVYYFYKYDLPAKQLIATLAPAWVLIMGFSRVWLGVHNPTDVIGAIILGIPLVALFVTLRERV